jgi:hypothetical protein
VEYFFSFFGYLPVEFTSSFLREDVFINALAIVSLEVFCSLMGVNVLEEGWRVDGVRLRDRSECELFVEIFSFSLRIGDE